MNFDIRFDCPIYKIPPGGVFMTESGDVYQRIEHGQWAGLYRNLRDISASGATGFPNSELLVHRIMTPLIGVELVFLAGWYSGRLHEMKQAAQVEAQG